MAQQSPKLSLDYVLNDGDDKTTSRRSQSQSHAQTHRRSASTSSAPTSSQHASRVSGASSSTASGSQPAPSRSSTAAGASSVSHTHTRDGIPDKNFVCDICAKAFAEKGNLKKHVSSVHHKEKPKRCPYPDCGKSFSFRDGLGRHIAHVHDNVRPYPCDFCYKNFKQSSHLTKHIRTIHKTS